MPKYYKFTASTPYVGTEDEYFEKFENEPTETQLSASAATYKDTTADDYEYLVHGWGAEEPEDEEELEMWEEELELYRYECECSYEEISEGEYLAGIGI